MTLSAQASDFCAGAVGLQEHGNGRRDDLVDFLARRRLGHRAKKPGTKNARLRKLKKLRGG